MYFKSFICVVLLCFLSRCNGEYLNMAVGEDEKPVEYFVEEIEAESELEVAEIHDEFPEEIESELIEPENQCCNEERVDLKPKRIVRRVRSSCGWPNCGQQSRSLENDYLTADCEFAQPKIVRKRPQCIVKRAAKPSTRVVYLKKRSSESCERKAPVVTESCKMESEAKSSKCSEPKIVEEEPVVQEKEETPEPVAETAEEEKPAETKSSKAEEPAQKKPKSSSKKSKPVKAKKSKKISKK